MSHRETFSADATNIGRNETIYTESPNSFPDPSGGEILLDDKNHYILTKPVNPELNKLIIGDNNTVLFSSTNAPANILSTDLTGTTPFISGNITRLVMQQMNIASNNLGGHFVDLSNNITPGFVFWNVITIQGFDSVGTIEGASLSAENVGFLLNDGGLTLNDMLFVVFREAAFTVQKGDHLTFTGTLIGATFDSNIFTPATGDAVFNIDASLSITDRMLIHHNLFDDSAGGTLFKAGGKDQTDPQVVAFNNGNHLDSYWIGSAGFVDNTVPTIITSINTLTDIAGVMIASSIDERFTVSGNVITYIGKEDIKALTPVDISVSRTTPASSIRRIQTELLVDSGSGFIVQGSCPMDVSGNLNSTSFNVPLLLKEGDKIKAQVRNVSTTDNMLFNKLRITVPKL